MNRFARGTPRFLHNLVKESKNIPLKKEYLLYLDKEWENWDTIEISLSLWFSLKKENVVAEWNQYEYIRSFMINKNLISNNENYINYWFEGDGTECRIYKIKRENNFKLVNSFQADWQMSMKINVKTRDAITFQLYNSWPSYVDGGLTINRLVSWR